MKKITAMSDYAMEKFVKDNGGEVSDSLDIPTPYVCQVVEYTIPDVISGCVFEKQDSFEGVPAQIYVNWDIAYNDKEVVFDR